MRHYLLAAAAPPSHTIGMKPADLFAAIKALTGDVRGVAEAIGYDRRSIYRLLDGRSPIKPDIAARIAQLLQQRRDEIDAALEKISH